jgi:SAM-dependent methyltransferase
MIGIILRHVLILAIISLNFLCCKSQDKPANIRSSQNLRGYPLLKNTHSIKKLLKQKCLDTINIENGETIADVGAGNGYLEGMLSLFHDSLTFYIQDVDTSICNQKSVDKVVDFYKKLKGKPFNSKFYMVNGSDFETNLPDETFDKIFMLNVYPCLKYPQILMTDLKQKLKPDGRMYVINPIAPVTDFTKSLKAEYGWNMSSIGEEITDIIECGFELVSLSKYNFRTNGNGHPYILVFRKKIPKN